MRNPKWHRDEIILALNLYFSPDRGSIDSKNPKIVALSELLNRLPLQENRPDKEKFRNPNGVTLKLSNFLSIDETYAGQGMSSVSKLDREVFHEFEHDKARLARIAAEIMAIDVNEEIRSAILAIEEDEQTINDSVSEGAILYKLHKSRERSSKIVMDKKKQVLAKHGKLCCEVCAFDFEAVYGELGVGFIECHHRVPLSSLSAGTHTTLADLALVCANCHRMLHRKISTMSIEQLRAIHHSQ